MSSRQNISFIKSLTSVSGFTILCRITGYAREILFAHFIGINIMSDALTLAIKAPSFFRRIFAEGAFHTSFVPIFTSFLKNDSEESRKEAFEFAGVILSILALTSIVCVAIIEWKFISINKFVFSSLASGHADTFALYTKYCRVTLPFIVLIALASFFGSVLNSFGRFGIYASSQMVGNMTMIIGVIAAKNSPRIGFLCSVAVLASGLIQFLWVTISCYKSGFFVRARMPRWSPAMKKFFRNIGPGALGVAVVQINVVLCTYFASSLAAGSISYMSYADRLNQLPLSIIGISLSSVLLPVLSLHIKNGDNVSANKTQNQALRLATLITFPIATFMASASYPIILSFFGYGKMTGHDIEQISGVLMMFGFGIPACVFIKVLSVRFFSIGNTRVPLYASCVSLVIDVMLSLILKRPYGCMGLGIASSAAVWSNVIFLLYQLQKKGIWNINRPFLTFFKKIFMSCASVFVMCRLMQIIFPGIGMDSSLITRTSFIAFMAMSSCVIFVSLCFYMKVISKKQLRVLFKSFKKGNAQTASQNTI